MTGFRQALTDAVARGALPASYTAPTWVSTARNWARGFAGLDAPGQRFALSALVHDITALPRTATNPPAPSPGPGPPHIHLSFDSGSVVVTGSGFEPDLPGSGSDAVHLRIVDVNDITNRVVLPYPSDGSGNLGAQVSFTRDVLAGLAPGIGHTVVAFSAYDNRVDPASPSGEPLTSNTVRVTDIASSGRQVQGQ